MVTRVEYAFEEIMEKDLYTRFSEMGRQGWKAHHKVRDTVTSMGPRYMYCFERVVLDTSSVKAKHKEKKVLVKE